jgi:alcohol dehydrogenase class IV
MAATVSQPFDFLCATRIVAGPGTADRVGKVVASFGARRALVLADPEILTSGRATALATSLEQSGVGIVSTVEMAAGIEAGDAVQAALARAGADVILTIGGDLVFEATERVPASMPVVGVPTVASSGAGQAQCRAVVLDPELSVDVADPVARAAAITAIARAVESWVTANRNPLSDMFAREAWRALAVSYIEATSGAADLDALGGLLLGAFLADVAASQSGLGALDACARPIARRARVGHGPALAMLLPEVVRWNARVVADRYAELASVGGQVRRPETLIARLEDFVAAGGFPERLGAAGIPERELPALAALAAAEPSASSNPRKFDVAGALELYAATY